MAGLQQEPPRVRGGNNHTSAVDLSFFNCKDYDHQDMNQVMKLEILIAILVFVMAGCFFGEMGHVRPAAADVLKCMFIHKHSGDGTVGDAIALFGALVMQHNLFLHSGHFLTWKIPNSVCGINCSTWFLALRQEGEVDQEEGKPSKHHCVLSAVSLSRRISGAAAAAVDSQFPLSSAATSRYLFVEGEGAGAVAAHHAHTRVSALMRFSGSYTLIF